MTLGPGAAEALAARHGTPLYVYDLEVLRRRAAALRTALPTRVLYGVKANPHLAVLRALRGAVDGLDVASVGELQRALEAGWPGAALSFAGPGKREPELAAAVAHDVLVSVESPRELEALARLARAAGRRARVRLRVNPRTTLHAFRVRMTGGPSPFGLDEEALPEAVQVLRRAGDALAFDGVHVHAGGQCTSAAGFVKAAEVALDVVARVAALLGARVPRVNLGGGLGVLAPGDELDVGAVGTRLTTLLEAFRARTGQPLEAIVEPGRWLVGPAGLYVARVVSEKVSRGAHFVVLDGGFNHHLAATGHLAPASAPRLPLINLSRPQAPVVTRTVVGPLCTPLDSLGVDVHLPEPRVGDLLGVVGSGAYGYSFSPLLFLGHPLPAEVVLGSDEGTAPGAR